MTEDEEFLTKQGYDIEKVKKDGRKLFFSFKAKNKGIEIGQSYKNKAPYEGEGEIIIAELGDNVFPEMLKVVHACHLKHKSLNGTVQYLDIENIEQSYVKIN